MKILVIASYAESLIKFRGALLAALVEKGHDVVAAAPNIETVQAQLREIGVRSAGLELARTGLNPFADIRTIFQLRGLMRSERAELVLAYTIKPVIYGSIAARMAGSPRAYSLITGLGSSLMGKGMRQWLLSRLNRSLYKFALTKNAGVLFQNHDDLAEFKRLGLLNEETPVTVVNGSGVDTQAFAPAPLPAAPVFLLIARLIADKGIREYVAAAREVRREYPASRCLLAGWFDTNPSRISEAEVKAWCEEGVIEYLGALDDVRPALASCRFYVLPSYREGLPRTVLEAMSMGRPVITTDVPGCREAVIAGHNGLLVADRDSAQLAKAMKRLINEPRLAENMGAAGRERAVREFDVHKVNGQMLKAMGLQ